MSNKIGLSVGFVVLVLALFFLFGSRASSFEEIGNYEGDMTIYKSGSCGCCGVYSNYFKGKGNPDVKVVNLDDMDTFKDKTGVPKGLESCHTTIIGDYFIEGHIPLEAIDRLLSEKPDIAGITMPGMPSGSPGMPGAKTKDFIIYAVNHDGSYKEWMRV